MATERQILDFYSRYDRMTSAGEFAPLCDEDLTREPDASFDELRKLYEQDDCLRVPDTVFNAVLNRSEAI
jgi:hypothetical protein